MAKNIETLSLSTLKHLAKESAYTENGFDDDHFFIAEHIFISMSTNALRPKLLRPGHPYRVNEGRVLMVKQGKLHIKINLEEFWMEAPSVALMLPDSVFEILDYNEDFDMQVFSFKDIPHKFPMRHHFVLHLNEEERQTIKGYTTLLWNELHQEPSSTEIVFHLQKAILLNLQRINDHVEKIDTMHFRQKNTFRQLLELIKLHGLKERKIEFYAEALCLTPNYLSNVIKRFGGQTIKQYINNHLVQEIKYQLCYSDKQMNQIADQLSFKNFSHFSKFFKKETGLTPGEYRKKHSSKV